MIFLLLSAVIVIFRPFLMALHFAESCVPDHHVHASTDFKDLNILHRSTSSRKTAVFSRSTAVSVHTFTPALAQLLPRSPPCHTCLRGSSPVAPRVHPIYSNSADQLRKKPTEKPFGTL